MLTWISPVPFNSSRLVGYGMMALKFIVGLVFSLETPL